jgi:hypothetical protein
VDSDGIPRRTARAVTANWCRNLKERTPILEPARSPGGDFAERHPAHAPYPFCWASLEKPRPSARRAHPISMGPSMSSSVLPIPIPMSTAAPLVRGAGLEYTTWPALCPAVCRYQTEAVALLGHRNVARWPSAKEVAP